MANEVTTSELKEKFDLIANQERLEKPTKQECKVI